MRRLEEEAATDFLTGAFNRRGIERILVAELERNRRSLEPLSIAIIDIDHFKDVNDRQGHAEGDRIVTELARLSHNALRPYDSVGRLGGDEFVVVLPGTTRESACTVAERIREAVAANLSGVTVSVGVATRTGEDGLHGILQRADRALYVAKDRGRNCVHAQ